MTRCFILNEEQRSHYIYSNWQNICNAFKFRIAPLQGFMNLIISPPASPGAIILSPFQGLIQAAKPGTEKVIDTPCFIQKYLVI